MSDAQNNQRYWDLLASLYQEQNQISLEDYHYGPLLAGDSVLGLLPERVSGLRCLELGCGAGQNSIVLAKRGAVCWALDVSEMQIEIGREFASEAGVEVTFERGDMEAFDTGRSGNEPGYDLIHSTYALPFASDPAALAERIAKALAPGGQALITTGHPLYAGEWLEASDGEQGIFIADYWDPFQDVRLIDELEVSSVARFHTVEETIGWFTKAGLVLDRLLEPKPLPEDRVRAEAPYWSEDWIDQLGELSRIPIVLVLRFRK